jgi:hypothetical protein
MRLLHIRDARFVRGRSVLLDTFSVDVGAGQRLARTFTAPREAAIAALIAAGIVRASEGRVFIADYDPRIQPVQCKRIAGYVPHEAIPLELRSFEDYIEYRAALWGIDRLRAIAHAEILLEQLAGIHEAFAYPLVGALLPSPRLLVLDRPQAAYALRILNIARCAIFSTHCTAADASAYAPPNIGEGLAS